MAENFICLITFCDGSKPVILDALQSKESGFSEILPYIKEPYFMKFNNSAILQDNKGSDARFT